MSRPKRGWKTEGKNLINFVLAKWKSAEPWEKHREEFVCQGAELDKGRGKTREDRGLGTETVELQQHTKSRTNMKDNSPRDLKHSAVSVVFVMQVLSYWVCLWRALLSGWTEKKATGAWTLGCSAAVITWRVQPNHTSSEGFCAESRPRLLNSETYPYVCPKLLLLSSSAMPPFLCRHLGKLIFRLEIFLKVRVHG